MASQSLGRPGRRRHATGVITHARSSPTSRLDCRHRRRTAGSIAGPATPPSTAAPSDAPAERGSPSVFFPAARPTTPVRARVGPVRRPASVSVPSARVDAGFHAVRGVEVDPGRPRPRRRRRRLRGRAHERRHKRRLFQVDGVLLVSHPRRVHVDVVRLVGRRVRGRHRASHRHQLLHGVHLRLGGCLVRLPSVLSVEFFWRLGRETSVRRSFRVRGCGSRSRRGSPKRTHQLLYFRVVLARREEQLAQPLRRERRRRKRRQVARESLRRIHRRRVLRSRRPHVHLGAGAPLGERELFHRRAHQRHHRGSRVVPGEPASSFGRGRDGGARVF